eukprot:m.51961 g.51961  ORF g.51961 m.51961 type:complete len:493 (-) comp7346_c0_seq1:58-1536(-)
MLQTTSTRKEVPPAAPSTLTPCLLETTSRWLTTCRHVRAADSGCVVPVYPTPHLLRRTVGTCTTTTTARPDKAHMDGMNTPDSQHAGPTVPRRRRNKRARTELNQGERDMAERHARIRDRIAADTTTVLSAVRTEVAPAADTPSPMPSSSLQSSSSCSNDGMRLATHVVAASASKVAVCETFSRTPFPDECTKRKHEPYRSPLYLSHDSTVTVSDLCNRLVCAHASDKRQAIDVSVADVGRIVLPPGARFICSDVASARTGLKSLDETFDLIVVDPPWENKSVRRGGGAYATLPNDTLEDLPVARLCHPGTLVAVWCTNKARHVRFVEDELFRAWGVTHVATWHWVKVRPHGDFVHPLDSPHKKPYEPLLIARCGAGALSDVGGPQHPITPVPPEGTFVSVPSPQHSRKPILADLLMPYVCPRDLKGAPGMEGGPPPQCLELFGRNLLPGWTTWGNDVLRFQTLSSPSQDGDGLLNASDCGQCRVVQSIKHS